MREALDYKTLAVEGGEVSFRTAGNGDRLVVLLHGWPQTAECWDEVATLLADRFTVVAPDLPGYGRSSAVAGGGKRAVAARLSAFVTALGWSTAMVAGHDRGARVAHRWVLDHHAQVSRLAVLDVIPMLSMLERMDAQTARAHWHWFFHLAPQAEALIGRDVQGYIRVFLDDEVARGVITPDRQDRYLAAYANPVRVEGFLADYRASLTD